MFTAWCVTLASPLIFHRGSYNSSSPGTLWYHLIYISQKREVVVTTALRASNPKNFYLLKLILFVGICALCKWAMLLTFCKFKLPPWGTLPTSVRCKYSTAGLALRVDSCKDKKWMQCNETLAIFFYVGDSSTLILCYLTFPNFMIQNVLVIM
jgi:hypothetical protein